MGVKSLKLTRLCVPLLAALLLSGCGDAGCYDNGSAVPLARFYASGTTTQAAVSGVSVTAIGVPGDTMLVNDATVSELHLPLRISASHTQWRISFLTTDSLVVNDTLTMRYRPIEYFASVECGAMYHFDLTEVSCTSHVIDSVRVEQPRVTHVDQVNLRLYVPAND